MGKVLKTGGNVLKNTSGLNLLTGGKQQSAGDLISAQSKAQQINTNTPFGSLTYGVDSSGRTTANYAPSSAFSGLSTGIGNYLQSGINDNFNTNGVAKHLNNAGINAQGLTSGLPELGNPQDLVNGLGNFGSIDTSGLPNINQDFGAMSKQAQDATYQSGIGLLQPQLDLQRRRTQQQLADQGLPISGEAYNSEMNRLDTSQGQQMNNLALASVLAGNDRQSQLYGQALQGNNQLFGQQSTMADLLDRQRGQKFGENQGVFGAQAQNRNQLFDEKQAIADILMRKQFGLAGLSNQNVQTSMAALQPQTLNTQGVDAAGIMQNTQAQKNAMMNGLMNTGGMLGAAAIKSDFRLKENIKLVGEHNGYQLYEFNYKGEKGRYRGVMAQEVEEITPEAVVEVNGFKAVRYDMINVPFERIA